MTPTVSLLLPVLQFVDWFNAGGGDFTLAMQYQEDMQPRGEALHSDATAAAAAGAEAETGASRKATSSRALTMTLRDVLSWICFMGATVCGRSASALTAGLQGAKLQPWEA